MAIGTLVEFLIVNMAIFMCVEVPEVNMAKVILVGLPNF